MSTAFSRPSSLLHRPAPGRSRPPAGAWSRVLASALLGGAAIAGSMPSSTAAATLYHLTFDEPHSVGLPVVTGYEPWTRWVASPDIDLPTVVESLGTLADRPIRLDYDSDGTNPAESVTLRLDDPTSSDYPLPLSEYYTFEADLLVDDGDGDAYLVVHFDAPAVRNIYFFADGTSSGFVSGVNSFNLPGFTVGDVLHLRVDVDLEADTWRIFFDGAEVYGGPFGSASVIETIRVGVSHAVVGGRIRAGADNLLVTIPEEDGCRRVTFNALALNESWAVGESFVSNDVRIDVEEFYFDVGPCGGASASGDATVVGTSNACGGGREMLLSNATLDFDFHTEVQEVLIRYGEYGGTVSLSVNGDCEVVDRLYDLSGLVLGGVLVTVFDANPNAQGCGLIRLGGAVSQLSIGGQEFFVDQITYCPVCGDLRRSAFEDQVAGTQYSVGDSFVSGGATHTLRRFSPPGTDCTTTVDTGVATIEVGDQACQYTDLIELELDNITDEIDFGEQIAWLVLSYGEYGGNVNLRINGDCRNADDLVDLTNATIGGVQVWVVDYPGSSCGSLYAVGNIEEFGIGGQEFWIDNIRTCRDATSDAPTLEDGAVRPGTGIVQLRPNEPNPFREGTELRFDLGEATPVSISIHDVGGRLVRALATETLAAGPHQLWWDGRDDRGRALAAGSYLCRIRAGASTVAQRMVLLPR